MTTSVDDEGRTWQPPPGRIWTRAGKCDHCEKQLYKQQLRFGRMTKDANPKHGDPCGKPRWYCMDRECRRSILSPESPDV